MSNISKLTILLPLYNSSEFLVDLIDCILKNDLPRQTVKLVMIDDGSNDKTIEIIETYLDELKQSFSRVMFFRQHQNVGVSQNHKTLLTFVETEYFCFIDSDDVFSPDKLRHQINVMDANSDFAMCGTDHVTFNRNEKVVLPAFQQDLVLEELDLRLYLKNIPPSQNSTLVYRTSMFRLFEAGTRYHFDIANQISIMCQDAARMCILRFPFSGYRVGTGYSKDLSKNLPTFLKVIDDIAFPIICMGSIIPRHIIFVRYLRFLLPYLKILFFEHGILGLLFGVARAIRTIPILISKNQSLPTLKLEVLDAEKHQENLVAIGH